MNRLKYWNASFVSVVELKKTAGTKNGKQIPGIGDQAMILYERAREGGGGSPRGDDVKECKSISNLFIDPPLRRCEY